MLFRNCAGGVVFKGDQVFLLKNEKNEWVFPKGVIRQGMLAHEVAVSRVKTEAGIEAEILSKAGQTSYEFYSITRQKPVCNEITWYIMRAKDDRFSANAQEGFKEGKYLPVDQAVAQITYSQDKALLRASYERYKML